MADLESEIRRLLFNADRVHAVKFFGRSLRGAPPTWEVTVFRSHAATVTGHGPSLLAAVQAAAGGVVHAAAKHLQERGT